MENEEGQFELLLPVECEDCKGYGTYYDAYFGGIFPCENCGGNGEVFA